MATVTANMVKDLRDKTGAGMMDCKAALSETNGDMEAAVDWLRKKGISKAAKKSGRVAAEGLIGVAARADAGALVEVNSETDFVARNDEFKEFVKEASQLGLEAEGDVEKLLASSTKSGPSVDAVLKELIAKIGENMSVRRATALAVSPGVVATYVHNATSPELGKIGVLVGLKSTGDQAKLSQLGRQIAMHVAAASPLALTPEHLAQDVVEREREVQRDLARQSGKPEAVIEKMMEGRMRKFYEDTVLLAQKYLGPGAEGDVTVAKLVENEAKQLGTPIEVAGFVRYAVGEGIDKGPTGDFADEVKQMAGQ
ncbi:MAG TPA: translation elongation factor Ts [Rhizomicrobium sp.]|jgi:elongation factor Ts|nr:translation elongation factor Ts [Rhizomicrobium sp.]